MMQSHLGKIFISHSSADRAFVRQLDRSLRRSGYDTWLDEHELVAGDSLSNRIAEGVRDAQVVLVVVSNESVKSKWLGYELNLATGRMVKGECRVIPLVIDDAELPAEVLGLLYANFRVAFKHGMKSVRTALQHENTRAEGLAAFWSVARDLVHVAFGGSGHVALGGKYADRSYDIVEVEMTQGDQKRQCQVFVETISSYRQPPEVLNDTWWSDFCSSTKDIPEELFLMVTERPVAFDVVRSDVWPAISYRHIPSGSKGVRGYVVFVDLSSIRREEWMPIVAGSKQVLSELAGKVPTKARQSTRNWPTMLIVKTLAKGERKSGL
jgi:hypothetical protein